MTTTGMTAANPMAHETLRRADLATVAELLQSQRMRSFDLSSTGRKLWVAGGNLIVQGQEPILDDDGVIDPNGQYAFGEIGLESLAARLGRSRNDMKADHTERTDLFDTVVGYLLRGEMNGEPSSYAAPDNRIHTLRLLRAADSADNEVDGMVRAVLGSRYLAMDNLDAAIAVTNGLERADIDVEHPDTKIEIDLTETRMMIKVWMPQLYALAPAVFGDYVSPFSGLTVTDMPKVFAGLVFTNSEVGRGAWEVMPRIVFQACSNGSNITKDVMKERHVGSTHTGDGVIEWSAETQQLKVKLITSQTADAVRTYLDVDYVARKLDEMAQDAGVKVTGEPEQVIAKVTKHTGHANLKTSVLGKYLAGRQYTAGGVMQAYTAAAQEVANGDTAHDLESSAITAMQWVAARA